MWCVYHLFASVHRSDSDVWDCGLHKRLLLGTCVGGFERIDHVTSEFFQFLTRLWQPFIWIRTAVAFELPLASFPTCKPWRRGVNSLYTTTLFTTPLIFSSYEPCPLSTPLETSFRRVPRWVFHCWRNPLHCSCILLTLQSFCFLVLLLILVPTFHRCSQAAASVKWSFLYLNTAEFLFVLSYPHSCLGTSLSCDLLSLGEVVREFLIANTKFITFLHEIAEYICRFGTTLSICTVLLASTNFHWETCTVDSWPWNAYENLLRNMVLPPVRRTLQKPENTVWISVSVRRSTASSTASECPGSVLRKITRVFIFFEEEGIRLVVDALNCCCCSITLFSSLWFVVCEKELICRRIVCFLLRFSTFLSMLSR